MSEAAMLVGRRGGLLVLVEIVIEIVEVVLVLFFVIEVVFILLLIVVGFELILLVVEVVKVHVRVVFILVVEAPLGVGPDAVPRLRPAPDVLERFLDPLLVLRGPLDLPRAASRCSNYFDQVRYLELA